MALYNANSTSNYRQYSDDPSYDVTNFTQAIWVQPLATNPGLGSFISRGAGSAAGDWNLSNVASSQHFRAAAQTSTGLVTVADTGSWTVGAWHHVAQTWDGSTLRLWVNGSNVASTALGGTFSASSQSIRAFCRNNNSNPFDGYLAEFGFWNNALTASEIGALALGVDPMLIRPDSHVIVDRLMSPTGGHDNGQLGADTGTLTYQPGPVIFRRPYQQRGKAGTSSGAMVGAVTMTLDVAGTASGAGAVTSSTTGTLTIGGILNDANQTGAMAGSVTMTLSGSGTLAGVGAIAASTSMSFTTASEVLAGVGAMIASIAEGLTVSGSMVGVGSPSSSTTMTLSPSGTLSGAGAQSASIPMSLNPAGTLAGTGALAASSTMSLNVDGSMSGPMVASITMTLTVNGRMGHSVSGHYHSRNSFWWRFARFWLDPYDKAG